MRKKLKLVKSAANLHRLRAVLQNTSAVSALEFALLAPVLIGILIPVADLGMGFSQKMQVENAAQAGVQYALVNGWDSTQIQKTVTSATKLSSITATPAPSRRCGCTTGTAVTTVACGSTCADGSHAGQYVTVSAQSVYRPLIPYPVLGSSVTLAATSTVRINQ